MSAVMLIFDWKPTNNPRCICLFEL